MSDRERVTEADIRAVLAGTYTPEGIEIWWNAPNVNLGHLSPARAFELADLRYVLAEAERVAGAM